MTDVFENFELFKDEISLYLLGFIDKEDLKRIINENLQNEYGITVETLPNRFEEVLEVLLESLELGVAIYKKQIRGN